MTDGDGAAVDVEFGFVDAELTRTRHDLRAEGFVDLEAIDVGKLEPCALEHGLDGGDRTDAHDVGSHADGCPGEAAPEPGPSLRVIGGDNERRPRAVDDGGGIPASLHPAEGGADG